MAKRRSSFTEAAFTVIEKCRHLMEEAEKGPKVAPFMKERISRQEMQRRVAGMTSEQRMRHIQNNGGLDAFMKELFGG